MKQFVLASLLALIALFGAQNIAQADSISVDPTGKVVWSTSECGEDVMFTYEMPRNDYGSIEFARSYDIEKGEVFDDNKVLRTSGSNICLSAGTGNVHRLRLGNGADIDMASRDEVKTLIRAFEDESRAEAERVMDAYGIKTASN